MSRADAITTGMPVDDNSSGTMSDRSTTKTRTLMDHESNFTLRYVQKFSPRSVEACAKEGILVENLIPLKPEDIEIDPDESLAIHALRFEHYQKRRTDLLEQVRAARAELVASGWHPAEAIDQAARKKVPLEALQALVGGATADMIETEKQRLQKLMSRQERDLEQLLKSEMKVYNMEEKQKQKEALRKKKEDEIKAHRLKLQQEMLDKAAQLEKRRAEEEERERQRRKVLQEEIYNKGLKAQKEQRQKEKQQRMEARLKAEERYRRQNEFKQKTEALSGEIQERIISKLQSIQRRDDMRRRKTEEAKKFALAEKARLAKEQRDRVEATLIMNQRQQEEKRARMALLAETQSRKLDDFTNHMNSSMMDLKKQRMDMDMRRKRVKEEAENELKRKIHKVLDRNEVAANRKRELEEKRREQAEFRKEQQRLKLQDKLDNVERKRRIEDYKRIHTAAKIQQDAERGRVLQRVKSDMIQERKRNHVLAQIQKEEIVRTFRSLRLSDNLRLNKMGRPGSAGNAGKSEEGRARTKT